MANSNTGGGTNEFKELHGIVRKARQNLTQEAWDTLVGGTETETTLKRESPGDRLHRVSTARTA